MSEIRNAAEEAARIAAEQEAARKAARRTAIRQEIGHWQLVIEKCNDLISRLQTENSNLAGYLSDWQAQYNTYVQNPVTEQVVITNIFEGVCADKIKSKLSTAVNDMVNTESSGNTLSTNVGNQITAISNYESTVYTKITSLQSELASLG